MSLSAIERAGPPEENPVSQPSVLQRSESLFHAILLVISLGVLGMACLLRVEGSESVVVPLIDQPLPGTCTYKRWLGIDCPGCGLTRCFISLAHGQLQAAWKFNPAGILLFGVTLTQVPLRVMQLWRIQRGEPELRLGWISWSIFWLAFAALFVQWLVKMAFW